MMRRTQRRSFSPMPAMFSSIHSRYVSHSDHLFMVSRPDYLFFSRRVSRQWWSRTTSKKKQDSNCLSRLFSLVVYQLFLSSHAPSVSYAPRPPTTRYCIFIYAIAMPCRVNEKPLCAFASSSPPAFHHPPPTPTAIICFHSHRRYQCFQVSRCFAL